LTINGEVIKTTFEHPFYVKDVGFVEAGKLQVGDKLVDSRGNVLVVEEKKLEITDKPVRTFPRCKVVAAHMGGFSLWDDVERFLVGTDIYLDTSYSLDFMDGEQAKRIIRNHDVKKILFATDSPWADQKEAISKLKSLNLDKETEDAILGLNAKALLGL